jgi:hypothetical protein
LESADRARRSIREGTAAVKFALHFGNFAFSDPEGARRLVRLAEAAGFFGRVPLRFKADVGDSLENPGLRQDFAQHMA